MQETTGDRVAAGRYLWEAPDKPVSVRLDLDVVERLGALVREGAARMYAGRGLEVGGLLLGRSKRLGGRTVTEIAAFQSLECEHAASPSFLLSDPDRRMLKRTLAARRASRQLQVVGFYRSHTRRDFFIGMEDMALFSTYFAKPSQVFLLIKWNAAAPLTAAFLLWEGGKIRSHSPYRPFPFDRAALVPEVAAPAAPADLPEAPPTAPPAPAAPLKPTAPRRARSLWGWAAAATIVVAVFLSGFFGRAGIWPATASNAPLDLRVTHDGRLLRLVWDHNAAGLRSAGRAVLSIRDGAGEEKIDLDRRQLQEGSIAYLPKSADVTFHLQVFAPEGTASESVRAIGVPPQATESLPAPAVAAPAAPTTAQGEAPPPVDAPRRRPRGSAQRLAETAALVPPVRRAPALAAPLPEPPTIATAPATSDTPLKTIGGDLQDARSFCKVTVLPASRPRLERVLGSIPLLGKLHKRPDLVPPKPLHEATPVVPPGVRHGVSSEVRIEVKVQVAPTGNVQDVELLSKESASNSGLASMALFASRHWQFVPARIGDQNVPGEVVLQYRFGAHGSESAAHQSEPQP